MDRTQRTKRLDLPPEVGIARRVIQKYDLTPPVDIERLTRRYAKLTFADIPFDGVDGISLNLKNPLKETHVIVNNSTSRIRQRFTVAHELGHILIPWHVGIIIDRVDLARADLSTSYWIIEKEANSFAAELLMPHSWIEGLLAKEADYARIHAIIATTCETSTLAAGIRLAQFLPQNVVFASERNGIVAFSGVSDGTIASPLEWEADFPEDVFDYSIRSFDLEFRRERLHWWVLPERIHVESADRRSWREILDGIILDIGVTDDRIKNVKSSISGVISTAVSRCKRGGDVDSLVAACMQRLRGKHNLERLVRHCDFDVFVLKRAEEIVRRRRLG